MSGARPYPKILRTTEAADATLRAYARKAHLAPFEALILAIGLLRTKDEREAASERAYKFAALWHDLARKLWHRWRSGLWALAREQNAADGLRREVASAREATRRADAEVERLTRELATERRLDVAAQEALRADVAREIETNKKLEAELAEARAALATKGATDRLAERVETIAAALPDELDQRVRACIAARPGRDLAFVLKNGCDRLEASDGYQDRQKAARKARS